MVDLMGCGRQQRADAGAWVALDVHKLSIVAATLPPQGGSPEVAQIETTRAAIRRFIERLGGPKGLAVCYEAGPGGFDLLRVLSELGVACDVIAPSLTRCVPATGSRLTGGTRRSWCGCTAVGSSPTCSRQARRPRGSAT